MVSTSVTTTCDTWLAVVATVVVAIFLIDLITLAVIVIVVKMFRFVLRVSIGVTLTMADKVLFNASRWFVVESACTFVKTAFATRLRIAWLVLTIVVLILLVKRLELAVADTVVVLMLLVAFRNVACSVMFATSCLKYLTIA